MVLILCAAKTSTGGCMKQRNTISVIKLIITISTKHIFANLKKTQYNCFSWNFRQVKSFWIIDFLKFCLVLHKQISTTIVFAVCARTNTHMHTKCFVAEQMAGGKHTCNDISVIFAWHFWCRRCKLCPYGGLHIRTTISFLSPYF